LNRRNGVEGPKFERHDLGVSREVYRRNELERRVLDLAWQDLALLTEAASKVSGESARQGKREMGQKRLA
jgi:hypothetical protein